MIPRATAVEVIHPYELRLTFEDGTSGFIDFRPLLFKRETGVFAALRDPVDFAKVRVDLEADTIVWPNGADIDPWVLYEKAHGSAVI
jgi:hypothetical protein